MMLAPDDVLARVSTTLRQQVGPEVGDEFARTQTYMAAVVLQKLSGQLAVAAAHADADRADRRALHADFSGLVADGDPPELVAAVAALGSDGADRTDGEVLGALVAAVHAAGGALGSDRFELLLRRVRSTLRSRLDRRLEYSA